MPCFESRRTISIECIVNQVMSISQVLNEITVWLAWSGLGLFVLTLIAFLVNWGAKFRLVGATIFTLLLSGSAWAFTESYTPPLNVEGAVYVPVVYDNGYDLVVGQASDDFPQDAIKESLEQIAGNLKGGGRNGAQVHVRIRKLKTINEGLSEPIILGEVIRDINNKKTIPVEIKAPVIQEDYITEEVLEVEELVESSNE